MGWKYSYYWAMIIFVIHNNRSEMLPRLEAEPEKLVPMFNEKAKKLGFEFTDNVPKIIDIQKVKDICDSLENISDEEYFKKVYGLLNDDIKSLPMSYLIYILANVKSSDVILDSNFQYGSVIKHILNYNHEQRIDGFEATLRYDFVLIFAYCMNAKNVNLYHDEFVPNRKEYDKALSIIDNDLLNPDIEEILKTDVDNPATEMMTLKYFLKR